MKLALFYNLAPHTVGSYFLKAFRELGHAADAYDIKDAAACPRDYDGYVRVDFGDYTYPMPPDRHPNAFYIIDTHLTKSWRAIRRQVAAHDLLFCVQQEALRWWPRAIWSPLACDPDIHAPQPVPEDLDVAFVGNDGGVPRKFYLQELRERYPQSFIGKAPYTEMGRWYSRARVVFHYIECTSPLKDMVSMRVFEALAARRLLLANALGAGVFEALGLRDRQELVLYRTPQELTDMLAFYLAHPQERAQIAAQGQACVLARHTYRHRAQQIAEALQQRSTR